MSATDPARRDRVVVTGATGYVGGRLLSSLLSRGVAVRALVRDRGGFVAPAGDLELGSLDLATVSVDEAAARLEGASSVVHAAAYLPTDYEDPACAEQCVRVNALGTLTLLEAARRVGVTSFVYFSSGSIYQPRAQPVTEDDPIYPSSRATYYLASKATADVWVDHYRSRHGIRATTLRIASVYGPEMRSRGMIPAFVEALRAGRPIRLDDAGRFRTDLVHVDDVVALTAKVIEAPGSGVLNVGGGHAATALEVARVLVELSGRGAEAIVTEPERPGAPAGLAPLDIEKARGLHGYAPRSLRDGLGDCLGAPV